MRSSLTSRWLPGSVVEVEVPSPGVLEDVDEGVVVELDEDGVVVDELDDDVTGVAGTRTEIVYARADPDTGSAICTVTRLVPGTRLESP